MHKILMWEYSKKTLSLRVVNFIMLYKVILTFYFCEFGFCVCMVIKRKLSSRIFNIVLLDLFVSRFIKLTIDSMGLQLTDRCQAVCPKLVLICSLLNKIVHVHNG